MAAGPPRPPDGAGEGRAAWGPRGRGQRGTPTLLCPCWQLLPRGCRMAVPRCHIPEGHYVAPQPRGDRARPWAQPVSPAPSRASTVLAEMAEPAVALGC